MSDSAQGLLEDWMPPELVRQKKAWADLTPERREHLERLQREHGWREARGISILEGEAPSAAFVA